MDPNLPALCNIAGAVTSNLKTRSKNRKPIIAMKIFPMSLFIPFLGVFLLSVNSLSAQSVSDDLIFPDVNRKFVVVTAIPSGDRKVAGKELAADDSIATLVLAEISMPFNWQMVRMSQCARNLVRNIEGPNLLFLSKNEGGFPRTGLWMTDLSGKETHYPNLGFVDLVLDRSKIERGDLSIYTHEVGHVMMGLILGDKLEKLKLDRSPKQHVSMGVTDYLTAFNEGWGVHFQRLAYDNTEKYRNAFEEKLNPDRAMSLVWHSGMDEYLRIHFVRNNGYVYEKLVQQGSQVATLDQEQQILLDHTSPMFDHTRVKNAQQMLSCEGVLATLFYQINSDKRLSLNYLEPEAYSPFLVRPIPPGVKPSQIFTPLENMMLKNFMVWHRMKDVDIQGSPMMVWLEQWCRLFPDDQNEIIRLFIQLTKGITISPELARLSEKINYLGQVGEYQTFKSLLPPSQDLVNKLSDQCIDNHQLLSANIGPELWVRSKTMKIRRALWMPDSKNFLAVNLNTAGLPELQVFFEKKTAVDFLLKRSELGFFSSFDQIKELGLVRMAE